jgi:hypothetical protein
MVPYFICIANICGGLVHLAHIVGQVCLPPCEMDLGWITKLPTADVFHRGCFMSVFVVSQSSFTVGRPLQFYKYFYDAYAKC